jgi:hypothetical protein
MSDQRQMEVLQARRDGWPRQRWAGLFLGVLLLLTGGGLCVSLLMLSTSLNGTVPLGEFAASTFLMLAMIGAGLVSHVVRNWAGDPVVGAILMLYVPTPSEPTASEAGQAESQVPPAEPGA